MDQWLASIPPLAVLLVVALVVAIESVGVPLPGETVLIAATLVSLGGSVSPWLVAASAAVGAIVGDSVGYAIGRRFGVRLLAIGARRFPSRFGPVQLHRAIGLMNRWGALAVIGGRFVAFLRILVGPLAGTLRMPYRRFLAANATGAVLWAAAVTATVTALGRAAIDVLHQFTWIALFVLAAAALVVAVVVVYRGRRRAGLAPDAAPDASTGLTADVASGALTFDDLFHPDGSLSPLAAAAGLDRGTAAETTVLSSVTTVFTPIGRAVRRTPFTTGMVGISLVVAVATGSLWSPLARQPWYPEVAFGVPSFLDGRWYTLITGTFFASLPIHYAGLLIGLLVGVGWAERTFGTFRAIGLFASGQIVAIVGSLFILLAARSFDSDWANTLAGHYDTGPSGGIVVCLAAVFLTVRAPWRLRLRFGLFAACLVALIYIGTLADLERFVAVLAVTLAAPFVLGARHRVGRPSIREWRLLAFASLVVLAVVEIIGTVLPSDDPASTGSASGVTWTDVALDVIVIALIANGVRLGHRLPWVIGVIIGAFNALEFVLLAVYAFVARDFPPDLFDAMANSSLWIAILVVLILGRGAYQVPLRRSRRVVRTSSAASPTQPIDILTANGGGTLSWMTMWPANAHFVTTDGQSYLGYQKHSGVAIALGDPIGPAEHRRAAVAEFVGECERIGLVPCLFSVGDDTLAVAPEGWTHLQVAEDTIIDLPTLEMTGKKWQGIRSALNRGQREGISFRLTELVEEPWEVLSQVRAISEEWVGDKALPEMGFTLGGVDEALDRHVRTALALDSAGTVQGILSWLPVYGAGGVVLGYTLDLMRRRDDGFKPVMEYLIASSCLAFKEEGAEIVSLSGAPLAREAAEDATGIDAVLSTLSTVLEPLYGFQSLHTFKTKFNPRYERMSLLYRDESDLPKIALGLTRAFLPTQSLVGIARMGLGRG